MATVILAMPVLIKTNRMRLKSRAWCRWMMERRDRERVMLELLQFARKRDVADGEQKVERDEQSQQSSRRCRAVVPTFCERRRLAYQSCTRGRGSTSPTCRCIRYARECPWRRFSRSRALVVTRAGGPQKGLMTAPRVQFEKDAQLGATCLAVEVDPLKSNAIIVP